MARYNARAALMSQTELRVPLGCLAISLPASTLRWSRRRCAAHAGELACIRPCFNLIAKSERRFSAAKTEELHAGGMLVHKARRGARKETGQTLVASDDGREQKLSALGRECGQGSVRA